MADKGKAFTEKDIGQMSTMFEPVDDAPPRLDEKAKVKCPECGHEFTP